MTDNETKAPTNFIHQFIDEDLASGKCQAIHTRFPPEPNGYLHIGHAKAINIVFSTAEKYSGQCNLRFDDTNPIKEEQEYIDAIEHDINWLGYQWHKICHTSDYFEQLCTWANDLIKQGKAYVDDQTADQIRESRGTLTEPGTKSPFRNRSVEENLELFEQMKTGQFPDGSKVLRAKIDMASPNLNMRDPVMYRILHATHPRTADQWCIYPMYDWAHGQSDSIENITHSLCSIEFEDHRPLYNWFIEQLDLFPSRQIEFSRLNITYFITSKRKLRQLVDDKYVTGWDDPRMPTLCGMRRRGYTPAAIRNFCETVGVTKFNATTEIALLEHCLRTDLNQHAQRRMAVLDPIKLIITNYPDDQVDMMPAVNNPENEADGKREVPFCKELLIERNDFMIDPPKKFFRLAPGKEVRLRYGYLITATDYVTDDQGNVIEVHCTYDPQTKGGNAPDGRKVKGTIHWVSARHALDAKAILYDYLFTKENPNDTEEGQDFTANINPDSMAVIEQVKVEPSLVEFKPGDSIQFERTGYFTLDIDSTKEKLIFNRTIGLRDTWAKKQKK